MSDLTKIQKDLNHSKCPVCGKHNTLSAVLRCDLGLPECMVTVRCDSCSIVYDWKKSDDQEVAKAA